MPLEDYTDSEPYWRSQAAELREKASVQRVFMSKLRYVLQVLHCSRKNMQTLHRLFAVFIWEQTSRTNLSRHVRLGGLSLSHLFLRQVVNRFMFLRDAQDPFMRTVSDEAS